MKNVIKAHIAPLFGFTARVAVILCAIAMLSLAGCDDKLGDILAGEEDPTPLNLNAAGNGGRVDDSIGSGESKWYSFTVEKDKTYAIYTEDLFSNINQSGKTADIVLSIKYQDFPTFLKGGYLGGGAFDPTDPYDRYIFTADTITNPSHTLLLLVQTWLGIGGTFAVGINEVVTNPDDPSVALSSVTANGSSDTTTTALTLTFDVNITDLHAGNILLTSSTITGIEKGDLVAGTSNNSYTLPITGFTEGGSVSVSVFKDGYNITGGQKTVSIYYSAGGGTETGLYTGIIGFSNNIADKQPVLLNEDTKADFTSFIDLLGMKAGTGLYYAVDSAITMLKEADLPDDLVNVSIVTFTDGLDNVSVAMAKDKLGVTYANRDAYRDAVKAKLTSTKIGEAELNISAYTIGIKGGDVADDAAFTAGLNALASSPDNVKVASDMDEVTSTFTAIADSLYSESVSYSIVFTIPTGDDGDKVRFTFDDNLTAAADSEVYIEGTITQSDDSISLTSVTYVGLSSGGATTIPGTASAELGYTDYTFEVSASVGDLMTNVQQWEYAASGSAWNKNSEFDGESSVEIDIVKKSAVIILVLDCTTSLDANDAGGFAKMKTAAKGFIATLVEAQDETGGSSSASAP